MASPSPGRARRSTSVPSSRGPPCTSPLHDLRLHAWQYAAHRSRLDGLCRRVRHDDPAGLGLPPVVVDRLAEHLLGPTRPPRRSTVRRRSRPAAGQGGCERCGERAPGLHQHPDRRRRRVPDGHPLLLKGPVPALRIVFALVDDAGDAMQQRRDDAVGHSRDPAGIGGAPVDVVGMQVQRIGDRS